MMSPRFLKQLVNVLIHFVPMLVSWASAHITLVAISALVITVASSWRQIEQSYLDCGMPATVAAILRVPSGAHGYRKMAALA